MFLLRSTCDMWIRITSLSFMEIWNILALLEYFKIQKKKKKEKMYLCMHNLQLNWETLELKDNRLKAVYFYQNSDIAAITLFNFKLKIGFLI